MRHLGKLDSWSRWVLVFLVAGSILRFVGLTRGVSDFALPDPRRAARRKSLHPRPAEPNGCSGMQT